jgi:hypothetical protein
MIVKKILGLMLRSSSDSKSAWTLLQVQMFSEICIESQAILVAKNKVLFPNGFESIKPLISVSKKT